MTDDPALDARLRRLRQYGLSLDEVTRSINATSVNMSMGNIRSEGGEIRIRALGRRYHGPDFGSIVVKTTSDGALVTLDRIADISRGLSRLLDEEDRIRGSYRLEVGTPGLERELRLPRHFEKSLGRDVVVKTTTEIAGQRRHTGRLLEAADDRFTIDTDGQSVDIPYADVLSAKTVFVWERGAKPGSRQETA